MKRTEGRNGKGIIYVFASGNENRVGDDTNFQGYGSNTRMTIPVGAVGKDGKFSSYSTTGASVFISAPGGDPRKAYTTVIAAVNNNGCKDVGTGTSNATPSKFQCKRAIASKEVLESSIYIDIPFRTEKSLAS